MKPNETQFVTKQESDRFFNPSDTRYIESGIGKGNVKVRKERNLPPVSQEVFNKASAEIAEGVKSGAIAKENAAKSERLNKSGNRAFPKDPTVKVRS